MPRLNSKRQKAIDQLEHAQSAISQAISLLGGYTRSHLPRHDHSGWAARKMIESCYTRLHAAVDVLHYQQDISQIKAKHPDQVALLDEFEKEYDKERTPGC